MDAEETESIRDKLTGNSVPRIVLEMTYDCNTLCPACCTNSYFPKGRVRALDMQTIMAAVEQAVAHGIKYCLFTGGEPTIVPHLVQAVKYASSHGMTTRLNSNGNKCDAELWRRLKDSGLETVCIGIDASHNDAEFNASPVLLQNALRTMAENIRNEVNVIVPHHTLIIKKEKEMQIHEQVCAIFEEEGLTPQFATADEYYAGRNSKHYIAYAVRPIVYAGRDNILMHKSKAKKCPCGIDLKNHYMVRVTPDGMLRVPCPTDMHMQIHTITFDTKDPEGIIKPIEILRENERFMDFLERGRKASQQDVCTYCIRTYLNKPITISPLRRKKVQLATPNEQCMPSSEEVEMPLMTGHWYGDMDSSGRRIGAPSNVDGMTGHWYGNMDSSGRRVN